MDWRAGERVVVRGAEWRVLECTHFSDCQVLDLEGHASRGGRTLLVPFDRPRTPSRPRLAVVSRRRWAKEVRDAVSSSFPYGGLRHCPSTVRLLAYQLEPALAMLRHGATRVLVADGVGLGKTVEAGLVARELGAGDRHARILILCPAALGAQWAHEMARLFDLTVTRTDAAWLRRMVREIPPEVNPWMLPGIYVASIDFVKRAEALRPLEDVRWDLLIVDEAHVATCGSDRRAAVDALAHRAARLLLLTATPHPGDDDQFRALCALGGGAGDPLLIFARDRSATPLGPSTLRSRVLTVHLSDEERQLHRLLEGYTRRLWAASEQAGRRGAGLIATVLSKRALSSPASLAISLRRRRELLSQTPGAGRQMALPLDDDVQEDEACDAHLGGQGLDDPREEARVLEALIGQAAAVRVERKLHALLRLIRRIGEPALIFTEYRDTAARLCAALGGAGHDVALLHGGLSEGERVRAAARLAGGRAHLVATDAASEGLNLHHACRLVVHFELPWTPARLHQRCGRVDRIGQTRRVHEVALVASDTSEQLVIAPLLARAGRSGSFARGPLMRRLAESQIAAHVLGGAPVPASSFDLPPGTALADLGEDARTEVARLEMVRRLGAAAPQRSRRRAIVPIAVVSTNPHLTRGLHVVFRITAAAGTGPPLLQEIVVLSCAWRLPVHRPRAADLRRLVAGALEQIGGLQATVSRLAAERVVAARPLREHSVRRLRRRAEYAAGGLSSAAEELVQAGLFDRRALRAHAARRLALDGGREHDQVRAGDAHIDVTRELLAVIVGGVA